MMRVDPDEWAKREAESWREQVARAKRKRNSLASKLGWRRRKKRAGVSPDEKTGKST